MLVRMGFSASAANGIYQRQGIDSIDEWANFNKDDVVSLLCSVRKPGVGRNGDIVGFKAELNIELAMFFIHNKTHTSRTVNYGDITVPTICALKKQREIEALKEPKIEVPKIDLKDI